MNNDSTHYGNVLKENYFEKQRIKTRAEANMKMTPVNYSSSLLFGI